mgnify:CR=1 FL=1
MKRRTLDVLMSVGGLVIAGLLLIAGLVLTANANFANDYVTEQLSAQHITFKSADTLTDEEKADQNTLFICVSRAERGCPRLALDL